MKGTRSRNRGAAAALTWAVLASLPLLVLAETKTHRDYRAADFGRIRYEDHGLTIVRAEADATREFLSAGKVNSPIFPGDALATGPNQRAEAQLANATVARIDQHSHVAVAGLLGRRG